MYKLKITEAAFDDLDAIYKYIDEQLLEPVIAQNITDEIEKQIRSLTDFPHRCALSRNELLAKKGYRILVVKNYVAPYLVNESPKQVIVARVFHGSMDYEKYI